MTGRLDGKLALITGASQGQGAAEARLFAREGARVYLCDILDEAGRALAREIVEAGGQAIYRHLDVSDEVGWHEVVDHVRETEGRLDVLVNNAGVPFRYGLMDTRLADWERVMRINLTGSFLGIQTAAPLMREGGGGSIVNTSSITGLVGTFTIAYAVSKWGVRGLTKCAAMELADWGIRVNSIHPGLVESPMVQNSPEFLRAMADTTPMGRGATCEEIATLVLFLASDESAYMTGSEVVIDGGFVAGAGYRQVVRAVRASAAGAE
ncbi:MAG: glucose 1-dehydrogenase [Chloroflexi bacterium]|nr:glucose 1-dehydrogenase [Chloroflexota bacterium]